MIPDEAGDRRVAEEMWTLANNEPLALAALQPFGIIDRERYRRRVRGGVVLELTLETDPRTGIWSYEFAILDEEGGRVDEDVVAHWLAMLLGNRRHIASRRSFLFTEARFTFPYREVGSR
ncbi:MAG: hypothetical protein ACKO5K_10475 [Armatimonadota bacterium]